VSVTAFFGMLRWEFPGLRYNCLHWLLLGAFNGIVLGGLSALGLRLIIWAVDVLVRWERLDEPTENAMTHAPASSPCQAPPGYWDDDEVPVPPAQGATVPAAVDNDGKQDTEESESSLMLSGTHGATLCRLPVWRD
jgi:hypothetical protein